MENDKLTKHRLNIMLHDDWEIYGDGSGDIQKLMFDPAKKILDICDKHKAIYTFYAEFGQQFAMLESNDSRHRKWAIEWENILKDAIKRGHDVQLHFHPQWIDAKFSGNKWKLDLSKWALASLSEDKIFENLKKGKEYLESLLRPINSNYKINSFRAGSWMNQPSTKIYQALKEINIKTEVSTRIGTIRDYGDIGKIDFSYLPSDIYPWYANESDFARESESEKEIISIPTYSEIVHESLPLYLVKKRPFSLYHYIKMKLLTFKKPSLDSPIPKKLNKGISYHCNFGLLHYSSITDMVQNAVNRCIKDNKYEIPFIMLAHSKSFYSFSNFEKLLKVIKRNEDVKFISTREQVEKLFLK